MDRVTEVTRECVDALLELRRIGGASLPPPQALHQRLRSFVEAMMRRAESAGFGREEAQEIAFPIVALADELVQSLSDELRAFWATQSLQLQLFQENVAGEEFFKRLERLRGDPRKAEILRAYYVALLLGFQGRYRVRGGELELLSLVEDLQGELGKGARYDREDLSPRGDPPAERITRVGQSMILVWAAAAVLAVSASFYLGMRISISSKAADVESQILGTSTARQP